MKVVMCDWKDCRDSSDFHLVIIGEAHPLKGWTIDACTFGHLTKELDRLEVEMEKATV